MAPNAIQSQAPAVSDASGAAGEHFVTVFDHRFLVQGLALFESLRRYEPAATLWVLCLDAGVEQQIQHLKIPGLRALSLAGLETDELRAAKANRSRVEYIYTLTPFAIEFAAVASGGMQRITYLDADLYFFRSPVTLFRELEAAGASVLMTEHGYAPQYARLEATSGRFCVQFLPVEWNDAGRQVVRDWQQKCLSGAGRSLEGRAHVFGDQMYLNDWPTRFPCAVYVSTARRDMLAPWNANFELGRGEAGHTPVFFHFHSLRLLPAGWIQLSAGYQVGRAAPLYDAYVDALARQRSLLLERGLGFVKTHRPDQAAWLLRLFWRALRRKVVLRRWPRRSGHAA